MNDDNLILISYVGEYIILVCNIIMNNNMYNVIVKI